MFVTESETTESVFLNAFKVKLISLYLMFGDIVFFRIISAICLWCIVCVLYQLVFQHFAVQTSVAICTQPSWLLVKNMSKEITTITAKNATTASTKWLIEFVNYFTTF